MTREQRKIQSRLNKIWCMLDEIQEMGTVQDNEEAMNYVGEAMGHVDNALAELGLDDD